MTTIESRSLLRFSARTHKFSTRQPPPAPETSGWEWQTLPDNVVRELEPDEAESAIVEMKRLGTFQRRLA